MTKKFIDKIKDLKEMLIVLVTLFTIFSGAVVFGWNKIAMPEIDKRIENKQQPIVDALKYQSFLMEVMMPDSLIEKAERRYVISKRGRP